MAASRNRECAGTGNGLLLLVLLLVLGLALLRLEDAADARLEHGDLAVVGNPDLDVAVSHECDRAEDSADGHDLVAFPEGIEHGHALALALSLRVDHQEVDNHEDEE